MKKKWTILGIMFLTVVILIIGCQKKASTKEEVYKDFQDKIYTMNEYTCKASVKVIGNKSPNSYEYIHSYKKTDNYRIEAIAPDHIKGKSIEYKGDKIFVKNPEINDLVELPNLGKNNQYLFVGDFIKNYLQSEEVDIKMQNNNLVLQAGIPGDLRYFKNQVLYVDADTKVPTKMEIIDSEGTPRFIVQYKEFKYK